MDLQGKTALVTGGAHRVGGAISLALADRGCNVVVHFHTSAALASETASKIEERGAKCLTVQADLSQRSQVLALFETIDQAKWDVDILVNSAAIMEAEDLLSADEDAWARTIDLNLKGAFFCLQQAAERMQAHGGLIVNITDIAAHRPWPRYPIHSISKAGLEMLTQVAALRLAPNIRVNAVAPGPVAKPASMSQSRWQEITNELPLKRSGDPQDVAQAVLFLVDNDFITGETLFVDGGNRWI
jgi:NAD(P)-dependent dehydrogenase (short-subunit alcohol dehydrogenase family)